MEPTKRVTFMSGDLELEGLLDLEDGHKAVVVAHPHPMYGGDMSNIVVETLVRAYGACGFTCLRFNFRGVGESKGLHDDGNGERDDVLAAFEYLKSLGRTEIHAAGYSFGAWVMARTQWPDQPPPMIFVAPPVEMLSFDDVGRLPGLQLVVVGTSDDFAPAYKISEAVSRWNRKADLLEIRGEDHFFFARTPELESAVMRRLRKP